MDAASVSGASALWVAMSIAHFVAQMKAKSNTTDVQPNRVFKHTCNLWRRKMPHNQRSRRPVEYFEWLLRMVTDVLLHGYSLGSAPHMSFSRRVE